MELQETIMKCEYPLIPLRGLTILPGMVIHFDLSQKREIDTAAYAMEHGQMVCVVTLVDPNCSAPQVSDLYQTGVLAEIRQILHMPSGQVKVLAEGISRLSVEEMKEQDGILFGEMIRITEEDEREDVDAATELALLRLVRDLCQKYEKVNPKLSHGMKEQVKKIDHAGQLMDYIACRLPLEYRKKQQILDTYDWKDRFRVLQGVLTVEVNAARIKEELRSRMSSRIEKHQKEYYLKEQLQYIREELGDTQESEYQKFHQQADELTASEEVRESIHKEIRRLERLGGSGQEAAVLRTYIETLLEMPWDKVTTDREDIAVAEDILDRDHYGLDEVKRRILEYLAVRLMRGESTGNILCLVGPPGTGKTSIARSIAQALNKEYVRVCLGGVRDEAEIRGHRKTYVGAMPGRIAEGIKKAGVKNPVMVLDELDKAGTDHRGDTASALLEVLDAEQNVHFRDHYIELPMDLSQVFFIATANSLDEVPRPLRDRMEIIEVSGYTAAEKFHIGKKYLVPKQRLENGLTAAQFKVSDKTIRELIEGYTREAGVRGLERQIGALCRKRAKEILSGEDHKTTVTPAMLKTYLGKAKYRREDVCREDLVGITHGLAWTQVGGDTLELEVNLLPGKGELILTGQMGDVMKESAAIAFDYVKSVSELYRIPEEIFEKKNVHLHIPAGAVPKDGPSAGITMATAILSAYTQIPVRGDLAMTGEVTLRGRVLPIGGLKEKLMAAQIAGMKTVLIPKENQRDLEEIGSEITDPLEICPVSNMEEVLKKALVRS